MNGSRVVEETTRTVEKTSYHPVVRVLLAIFSIYLVFSLISSQIEIRAKRQELAEVEAKCVNQEMLNKETERQLALGQDKAYIEWAVRNKLGYGYPDEKLFRDISGME